MYFLTAKQAPTRPLHGQFLLPGHISARYLHGMASPHFLCSNVTSSERLSLTTCCKIIASPPTTLTEKVGMRERSCSLVFAPGIKCLPPVILKSTSRYLLSLLSFSYHLLFAYYLSHTLRRETPWGQGFACSLLYPKGPVQCPVQYRALYTSGAQTILCV